MELWIRSQDKKRLVKVEHIYYCEDTFTNNELKHYICSIGAYDLGTYKTKERALEVLDEIQSILNPKTVVKVIDTSVKIDNDLVYRPQQYMKIQQLSTYVYEMPIE